MERFSGGLMVLAGMALGGYLILPSADGTADHPAEPAHIAAIPAPNTAQSDGRTASGVRVFSPARPLVMPAPDAHPATTAWTAVVTSERSSANQLKSPKPGDAEARSHLASDLQRELKRVGCYGGEINGAWTQSTRRAMATFMERVNATLPFDEPDYILLTLVENHTALACGTECPAGQVVSAGGQCLPNAVVAQANKRAQKLEERQAERRLAEQRKAEQQERLAAEQRASQQRRVAIAQRAEAQRLEAQRVERQRVADKSAKSAQVAAVTSEPLPWLNRSQTTSQATNAATPEPVQRPAPLPGMMSVGGPQARGASADVPAGAAVAATGRAAMPAIAPDRIDRDDLSAAAPSEIVAPAPRPAVRPQYASRDAELDAGLASGTKAGSDARAADLYEPAPPVAERKYSRAKIVRRSPSPYYDNPRAKRYSAYGYTGKTRRGQPRPGSPRYNLLLSLGGLY